MPDSITGVIILNLNSYAGGNDLWGDVTGTKVTRFSMNCTCRHMSTDYND
jgi:hypothetical protein